MCIIVYVYSKCAKCQTKNFKIKLKYIRITIFLIFFKLKYPKFYKLLEKIGLKNRSKFLPLIFINIDPPTHFGLKNEHHSNVGKKFFFLNSPYEKINLL